MHEHNGQLALAAAGVMDEFRSNHHAGAEATRVLGADGTVLFEDRVEGAGHGRPEVLRAWSKVRRLLSPATPLVGAAAHLMPPASEGANLAMLDGAELAQAIAAHPGDIEPALTTYESVMFTRSRAEAVDAAELQDICLGARAPHGLGAGISEPRRPGEGPTGLYQPSC